MLTFASMSERISIVVPDGTISRLNDKASKSGHTQSALCRKILLDGLKECEHLLVPCMPNGDFITNGNYSGPSIARCVKCGFRP